MGYIPRGIVGTVWTLTTGNTYCSLGYIDRGYRMYFVDAHSWQNLLFRGIHRQGVLLVLFGHSHLAILTIQWDTSPWGIVGTVWTLTPRNPVPNNTFSFRTTVRALCTNIKDVSGVRAVNILLEILCLCQMGAT